ncbi:hypothetical protein E9677_03700 [Rhizobium rhizophilum]|uniref:Uncharacterized protein n=1 Tax=Rhizobium rhizophilum TaxID=1850373 RepID=A0ABY2R0R9_9HYPH|nr:hypothetical protein E9677_03700 [Rhizobium rhizophilum]
MPGSCFGSAHQRSFKRLPVDQCLPQSNDTLRHFDGCCEHCPVLMGFKDGRKTFERRAEILSQSTNAVPMG